MVGLMDAKVPEGLQMDPDLTLTLQYEAVRKQQNLLQGVCQTKEAADVVTAKGNAFKNANTFRAHSND